MANTYYLKSGGGAAQFAQTTAYVSGNKIVPVRSDAGTNISVGRSAVWECTTPGTSAAANPTWPAAVTYDTTTVTSGTATFTARKPGYSTGSTVNWAYSTIFMDYAAAAMAAGDTLIVSNNHSESTASAVSPNFPGTAANPNIVVCMNDAATPPTTVTTGAVVAVTGNNQLSVNGSFRMHGVTLQDGSGGASAPVLALIETTTTHTVQEYSSCRFELLGNSSGPYIYIGNHNGSTTASIYCRWINCVVKFGQAAQGVYVVGAKVDVNGLTVDIGAATPTGAIFQVTGVRGGRIYCENFDFSNVNSGCALAGASSSQNANVAVFVNGKTPAGSPTFSGSFNGPGIDIDSYNVDNGNTNNHISLNNYMGSVNQDNTVVKGTDPHSWKVVTTNSSYPALPRRTAPIALSISAAFIGVSKTVTLYGVWNSASLPTNAQVALEVNYCGTSGNPQGVLAYSGPADIMTTATSLAADTSAWDSGATARGNTTGYSVGNVIKLASNPGRIFFCTTSGTSAGSEPAGYASAIDGASVTDGTAVFRAATRFKTTVSITAQSSGVALAQALVYPASTTVYISPEATLT